MAGGATNRLRGIYELLRSRCHRVACHGRHRFPTKTENAHDPPLAARVDAVKRHRRRLSKSVSRFTRGGKWPRFRNVPEAVKLDAPETNAKSIFLTVEKTLLRQSQPVGSVTLRSTELRSIFEII